jgi:methyl-accepting chemotaxis protein
VVAAEVRALALRCASAAREVNELVSHSTQQVTQGHELVDQAGHMMRQIVERSAEVSRLMSGIAQSTTTQYGDIEQINRAIENMDEGTQQNAALVEEASASAHGLAEQATQLVREVEAFRVQAQEGA